MHGGGAGLVRGAEDRHGLPVAGELQGELLLHQLFNNLIAETKIRRMDILK